MLIRDATANDIPAITALEQACFSDPWPENLIRRRLNKLLVAEADDHAFLGYAALDSVLDQGSLDSIAVVPDRRRQGAADALLAETFRRGRAEGLAFITLEVRASNRAAIALYDKHGFAPAGRRTNYYERPREDAIIMTAVL